MSTNRKILKVLSIISLIFSVITLILGVIVLGACAADPSVAMDEIAKYSLANFTNAETYEMLIGTAIALVIIGLWETFVSIMGIRGANNPAKMGFVTVIAGITLVLTVVIIIAGIVAGSFSIGELVSLAIYIFLFYVCCQVRKEGKEA